MLQITILPVGGETVRLSVRPSSSSSPLSTPARRSPPAPLRCAALRCGSPAATEWRGCPVPGGEDALAPLALCQVMEGNEEGGLLRDCSGSEQSAPTPLTAVLKTLRVPAGGPRTGLTGSVWLTAAPRLTLNRAV